MNISECQTQLNEPVEDLLLREMLAVLVLDERGEVAAVAVRHHDVQHLALQKRLAVPDDERMMKLGQKLHLLHGTYNTGKEERERTDGRTVSDWIQSNWPAVCACVLSLYLPSPTRSADSC